MSLIHHLTACTLLLSTASLGAMETETLAQAHTSWDGGEFHFPPGSPEISIHKARLESGEQTAWHCHPVPVFGYMLKGRLRVETRSGQQHVFQQGDAVVEVMNSWHRGTALDGPVEFVVFYAGERGLNTTVLQSSGRSCSQS